MHIGALKLQGLCYGVLLVRKSSCLALKAVCKRRSCSSHNNNNSSSNSVTTAAATTAAADAAIGFIEQASFAFERIPFFIIDILQFTSSVAGGRRVEDNLTHTSRVSKTNQVARSAIKMSDIHVISFAFSKCSQ